MKIIVKRPKTCLDKYNELISTNQGMNMFNISNSIEYLSEHD